MVHKCPSGEAIKRKSSRDSFLIIFCRDEWAELSEWRPIGRKFWLHRRLILHPPQSSHHPPTEVEIKCNWCKTETQEAPKPSWLWFNSSVFNMGDSPTINVPKVLKCKINHIFFFSQTCHSQTGGGGSTTKKTWEKFPHFPVFFYWSKPTQNFIENWLHLCHAL